MRRSTGSGVFALLAIGSFVAWRNRFQIRQFLESRGFNLPLDTSNVRETLRSGVAKVSGTLQRGKNEIIHQAQEMRKAG